MYKVDLYAKVRRAVMVEDQSERGTAKRFGISRKTVSKMLRHTVPPGYQRKDAPVPASRGASSRRRLLPSSLIAQRFPEVRMVQQDVLHPVLYLG